MSFSKITAFAALSFAALCVAQDSPSGQTVHLFPNGDCSLSGYYTQTSIQDNDHCTSEFLDDPNFEKDESSGQYKIWFGAPSWTGNYEVVVQTPLNADIPGNPCGYAAQSLKPGECNLVEVDEHWFINTCITNGAGANCPNIVGKRSNATYSPQLIHEGAPVVEKVTKRSKPYGVHMFKRADCSFSSSDSGYVIMAGDLQRITQIYDNSASQESSMVTLETSTTVGSSQTFGVESSIEAGLFDIVQASVSFSYMYTYEMSKTVSSSRTFEIPAGQSAYGAFIPYFECYSGDFSGANCNGVPTGQNGMACVPKRLGSDPSMQDGEYRTVQT